MNIFNIFRKKKPKSGLSEYHQFLIDTQKGTDRLFQEIEDHSMKRHIEYHAQQRFIDWQYSPEITLPDGEKFKAFFPNPFKAAKIYYIHDSETAKYRDVDMGKLINDRFEELKNEYESNKQAKPPIRRKS